MTKYRVMKKQAPDDPTVAGNGKSSTYTVVGTFDAHTAKAAIRDAVTAMTDGQRKDADGATFAATPDGSWTELTVGVAVETKVTVA